MSTNFKTCMFGGFDRGDVINYIEKSAKEAKERIEALENENNELRSNNERIEQALRALHAQAKQQRQEEQGQEALQQQLSEAQVHLNELAVEIDTLRAENEKLRAEAQSLRTESVKLREAADDYAHLKEHIADIEINAHRRTEEFRAEAIEKLRRCLPEWGKIYVKLFPDPEESAVKGESPVLMGDSIQLPRFSS